MRIHYAAPLQLNFSRRLRRRVGHSTCSEDGTRGVCGNYRRTNLTLRGPGAEDRRDRRYVQDEIFATVALSLGHAWKISGISRWVSRG